MSLESNIITGTPRMQTAEKHKQPFHMDGKKIVCNVCGEHFTNLVLFGNHTHGTDQKASIVPSDKSCPKSDHKTFNTMSEDEMIEAFHKMPELEGCWINNGRYICNMCGKSCPNPYVLFSHKIIHPEDMTPMVKGKETDSQQTLGVATQTKIELGYGNRNRKLDKNIRIDSDDDDSVSGDADDDNVQKPMHLMRRPLKKLKEMNTGNSNAKSQKTLLYKNLISYDRGSTFLKSKSIAKEPGKKSKPATGGDRRTGLRLSSDSEDEVYDSTTITSDDDVNGDNSLNLQGRPNQHLDTTKYKKKETNLYQSLIAVKGWPFVKAKKPPFEYCGNMFGHNFLDKCKIFNGRYYCDECPRLYSSPYLLLNHKLYHAKCKCLTQRCHALNGTTHKREESHEDTTDEVEEAQVSTTDEEEEAQVSTTDKMEESHKDTTDEEEESHEDTTDKEEEAQVSTTDKMEETHEGTTDEEEEDSMCFECNLCQVKFDTTDGLADHIEAHAADTQAGASCTLSGSALADVSKASTSACSTELVDDTIAVKVKKEPVTDYVGDTLEPQLEPSGLDPSVRIKQEPEPSNLPQHSIEDRMRTSEVDVPFEDKLFLKRSMLSPVVRLKRIKIIHPEDMTPMVKGKETDSQQTLGVATQTKIELGCGNSNRKLDKNIRIDSDDDDSESGDAAAAADDNDNESGDAAAAAVDNESGDAAADDDDSESSDAAADDDDDDDNVQKPMHLMRRPVKKLKEMNTGNSNAKSQKTLLYTTLISDDRGSTFLKSKSIAKEPGKKSKPATGGDRRTGLRLSSDSEDEVYNSTPITSDDDVNGDNSLNLQGRPTQNLDITKYKKKETNVYKSLIAVEGGSFVKAKKSPLEYCGNMFGHNFLDKCKILNGRYYCDECPRLYSSPYLLWNHKLYHAKCKCLTQRCHAQTGTTHKKEESHEDTTDKEEEAQVSTTDKMEESHEDTTDEEEESHEDTTGEEKEAQVSTTDKMEETHEGTADEEEEDSMCFECNLCQVKFDTTDGLADHIEAHAADTQAGASCTLSESALADVSKASTSACSTEMVDDTIAVKVKMEPITDYAADRNTLEPQLEPSGLDPSVRIKQEPEPSNLPQHSIEDRMQTGEVDVPFEDKLFLKRSMLSPVVRLKRIKIEPNDVFIMK
ncbi:uncharacterized protein LOC124144452 [Haliotis rufescens]|uniref:uncharacterized protein LOC124144452 n=1 Tax=Haliotis rufescens TaxID=6454 RepID=UPI00201FA675|nr:uncharacterized protein LOC124144452 [Haliotis rufescens]